MSKSIISSVDALTAETTKLLELYSDGLTSIDGSVTEAQQAVKDAKGQVTLATTQATNASKSATTAKGHADDSSDSATASASSASAASSSATAAKGSATAASGSATTASNQATAAANSATAALNSSNDSADSATASQESAEAAKQIVDSLDSTISELTKLPIVHAPLDNKLSLHAGIGDPVFVKSANQSVEIPAQNITVGAETVTIPQQSIVVEGQEIEVPDAQQIKFSRASTAWLDGKEYGVDEPRYTADGKLVVEGQSTNYFNTLDGHIRSHQSEDGVIIQTRLPNQGWGGYTAFNVKNKGASSGNYALIQKNLPCVVGLTRTLSIYLRTLNSDYLGAKVLFQDAQDNGLGAGDGQTVCILTGEWQRFDLTITRGEHANNYGYGGFYLRAENFSLPIEFDYCCPQAEDKQFSTTYIYTGNGVSTTRAADIALINGQNIVNRWENDQQPIDTDTPRLLTDGEHDMSADRFVKFERETSAWLDGKEYAAGEPRYKDGKLLVEPQATNFIPVEKYNLLVASGVVTGNEVAISFINHEGLFYYAMPKITTGEFYSFSATVHPKSSKIIIYIDNSNIRIVVDANGMTEGNGVVTALPDGYFRVTATGEIPEGARGNVIIKGFKVGGGDFNVKLESQLEQGTVATSYIPTTDKAVTRAADYAHVISKAAINTPTGLLPIGEHSVEPTAIRSFKRETSAWLDGVEYPADTPRYLPNGELLIEGQSTNLVLDSEGGWGTDSDGLTAIAGAGYKGYNSYIIDNMTNTSTLGRASKLLSTAITTGKQYRATVYFRHLDGDYPDLRLYARSNSSAIKPPLHHSEWQQIVVEATAKDELAFFIQIRANIAYKCEVALGSVTEINTTLDEVGSYIPTTGTAVTRAADECFVDHQLPPNTYRDLKGFKK